MSKKLYWTTCGALMGLAFALAEMFFEWRENQYLPWSGGGAITQNILHFISPITTGAIGGFIGSFSHSRFWGNGT